MRQGSVLPSSSPTRRLVSQFEAGPRFSVLFISGILGAGIPMILALYWIAYSLAPDSVGPFLRISILACAVPLGLFWYRAPFTHAEILLFRVLGVVAVVWLIPTFLATDPSRARSAWIRLIVLFGVCCLTARALRHPPTAHAIGVSLLASGVILGLFILFTYIRTQGLVMPTYKTARELKGVLNDSIPFNAIGFAAIFSYIMGLCVVRRSRILILISVPLLVVSTIFTGSRAPLVTLGASVFFLLSINGLRSKSRFLQIAAALLVIGAVVGGIVVLAETSVQELNHLSEGRSRLWSVAWQKFTERPLFGYGYESWHDDLMSRLPGEYKITYPLATLHGGGGYHNEYLSVLEQEGLIGALGAGLIMWLLLRSSWLLAFRQWATVGTNQWPLFTAIFLLLRSSLEMPGLFGDGHEPVDYLAYLLIAIVLSRFSVEEDYARTLGQIRAGSRS